MILFVRFIRVTPCLVRGLGLDVDGRPIGYEAVNLFDFGVGYCNAAVRPIRHAVDRAEVGEAIRQAMNHDLAAGGAAGGESPGSVGGIRVGDVQGQVVSRMRVVGIDEVVAFRSPMIPLLLLPARRPAERNLVGAQNRSVAIEDQCVGGFGDDNSVNLFAGHSG